MPSTQNLAKYSKYKGKRKEDLEEDLLFHTIRFDPCDDLKLCDVSFHISTPWTVRLVQSRWDVGSSQPVGVSLQVCMLFTYCPIVLMSPWSVIFHRKITVDPWSWSEWTSVNESFLDHCAFTGSCWTRLPLVLSCMVNRDGETFHWLWNDSTLIVIDTVVARSSSYIQQILKPQPPSLSSQSSATFLFYRKS